MEKIASIEIENKDRVQAKKMTHKKKVNHITKIFYRELWDSKDIK